MQGREINYYRAGGVFILSTEQTMRAKPASNYELFFGRLVALKNRSIQELKFLVQSCHSVVEGELKKHNKTKANNLLNGRAFFAN